MNNPKSIGVIILAAGASSRLGQPKQLVRFDGKSLLQNTLDSTKELRLNPRILVLGAKQREILEKVELNDFKLTPNEDWKDGMASSLKIGLQFALELNPQQIGMLILVCDQPYLKAEILTKMLAKFDNDHSIVACKYGQTIGVPVLFGQQYFDELLGLQGDQGAKKVLKKYVDRVALVNFERGIVDVDTREDLVRLKKTN